MERLALNWLHSLDILYLQYLDWCILKEWHRRACIWGCLLRLPAKLHHAHARFSRYLCRGADGHAQCVVARQYAQPTAERLRLPENVILLFQQST
jgi:hypothetical protein